VFPCFFWYYNTSNLFSNSFSDRCTLKQWFWARRTIFNQHVPWQKPLLILKHLQKAAQDVNLSWNILFYPHAMRRVIKEYRPRAEERRMRSVSVILNQNQLFQRFSCKYTYNSAVDQCALVLCHKSYEKIYILLTVGWVKPKCAGRDCQEARNEGYSRRSGEISEDRILGHQFAPCYSQPLLSSDLKKPILYSGFRNLHRKIHETRKLVSVQEYQFVEQKNVCRIPSKIGKIGIYVQKSRLKMLNKNSIPGMSRKWII
jgi:hypothetical protein